MDKVCFVFYFVNKFIICFGFYCDIEDDIFLSDLYVVYSVLDMIDIVKILSKRFFFIKCFILIGYLKMVGGCCLNCVIVKC